MENLIIGLVGVLIGAASSVATVWIQTSAQAKRDRLNVVKELALEDHKTSIENAKLSGQAFVIPPVTLYLHYHLELSKEMETGTLAPGKLKTIMRQNREIARVINEMQHERQQTEKEPSNE